MGLFHHANSLKWSALFDEITFFFPWENDYFTGKKIYSPRENFAWSEKRKLNSFFTLNILLGDEDAEYPAASLPLQWPAKGSNTYLGAWLLSVSLGCSCQFYSCEITKVLSRRQQEEKIHYGSSKTVLFFLKLPFHREKTMFLIFCPLLEGKKAFKTLSPFEGVDVTFPIVLLEIFTRCLSNISNAWGVLCGEKGIVPTAGDTPTFQWCHGLGAGANY